MTPEELLKPRYKVIAIDTTESFQVGEILNHPEEWHDYLWVGPSGKIIFYPEKYPHLFKKLEWWEERKPDEMPKYVRSIMQEYTYGVKAGVVIMVKEWVRICDAMYAIQSRKEEYHASCFTPATADDYNAYLQTLTVK